MKTPTDKQIALVERICQQLHLDFPMSSKEFNRRCFSDFISSHIDEFKHTCANHKRKSAYNYLWEFI